MEIGSGIAAVEALNADVLGRVFRLLGTAER